MSNRIEDLTPECQATFAEFKAKLDADQIPFAVVFTLRSTAEQVALYTQGRKPLDVVNSYRQVAGLPPTQETAIVTQCDGVTKKSNHQTGNAFDLTFADENGNAIWPSDPVRWLALGGIAESVGLVWGGRWTPLDANGLGWDIDHFEMPV